MPLILNLMCLGALASACTTVLVNTTSGVGVIGRTMELGSMDLPTDVTNTTTDAVVLAAGLLNTVHIVMGTVANTEHEDAGGLEWTEWSVVKVPAERKFYVRTYSA